MTEYREVTPIPGPEAFRERGRDLGRIGRQRKLRVEQAAGPLDIDLHPSRSSRATAAAIDKR
jgi:hypothetical protein